MYQPGTRAALLRAGGEVDPHDRDEMTSPCVYVDAGHLTRSRLGPRWAAPS